MLLASMFASSQKAGAVVLLKYDAIWIKYNLTYRSAVTDRLMAVRQLWVSELPRCTDRPEPAAPLSVYGHLSILAAWAT